jgi:hypothetical protein
MGSTMECMDVFEWSTSMIRVLFDFVSVCEGMCRWVPALQIPECLARLEEYVWEVWDISAYRDVDDNYADDYRMDGEMYIIIYNSLYRQVEIYPSLDGARCTVYITQTPRDVMSWLIRLSSSPLV